MYFCQKSEKFQESYIKKLKERLARDGFTDSEIDEIVGILKDEKMAMTYGSRPWPTWAIPCIKLLNKRK